MIRVGMSAALVIANVALVVWWPAAAKGGSGLALLAILVAVAANAAVERIRFGRPTTLRGRLDPLVVVTFLLAFDLVYLGVPAVARIG